MKHEIMKKDSVKKIKEALNNFEQNIEMSERPKNYSELL